MTKTTTLGSITIINREKKNHRCDDDLSVLLVQSLKCRVFQCQCPKRIVVSSI